MKQEDSIKEKAAEAIVSEAEAVARTLIDTAARTASRMKAESDEERMTSALSTALRDVFGENEASGRFVDVSRIPLLCKSVLEINENIKDIKNTLDNKFVTKESFWPVKIITYSFIGMILTAFVAGLLSLVFIK